MKINGKNYSRTTIKNNIVKIYSQCDALDLYDWYQTANNIASLQSLKTGIHKDIVVGIIAALSPLKNWNQNINCMESFIESGISKHMGQFTKKAELIINLELPTDDKILKILSGNKIQSFYLNIKYFDKNNVVTIDRHAISIALGYKTGDKEQSLSNNQYKFLQDCYCYAANLQGVTALFLQSSTWVKFRKLNLKTGEKF